MEIFQFAKYGGRVEKGLSQLAHAEVPLQDRLGIKRPEAHRMVAYTGFPLPYFPLFQLKKALVQSDLAAVLRKPDLGLLKDSRGKGEDFGLAGG